MFRVTVRADAGPRSVAVHLLQVEDPVFVTGPFGTLALDRIARQATRAGAAVLVCGPRGFVARTIEALREAGVPDERVATEAFVSGDVATELAEPPAPGPFPVRFDRSGVETTWTVASGTLLKLGRGRGTGAVCALPGRDLRHVPDGRGRRCGRGPARGHRRYIRARAPCVLPGTDRFAGAGRVRRPRLKLELDLESDVRRVVRRERTAADDRPRQEARSCSRFTFLVK